MEYVTQRLIEQVCTELTGHSADTTFTSDSCPILQRHALIKATAKDYIRDTQIRLILHPIAEQVSISSIQSRLSQYRQLPTNGLLRLHSVQTDNACMVIAMMDA